MYLKVHESPKGKVVAVCDADLIGKVLEGQGACMDLDRHRGFYMGKLVKGEFVEKALGSFSSANLVGKEAVGIASRMGLADDDSIKTIKGVPYVQLYRL